MADDKFGGKKVKASPKTDQLRAMREARYEANQAPVKTPVKKAKKKA